MKTLLLVFMALTAIHYAYDAILLPAIRLRLRYRLFAVRDTVRELMASVHSGEDRASLDELHGSINGAIRWLPMLDFASYSHAMRVYNSDEDFRRRIEKRNALLESCSVPEVKNLRRDIALTVNYSLLANSGGWCIYVVPVAVLAMTFNGMVASIRNLVLVHEAEFDRIAPAAA